MTTKSLLLAAIAVVFLLTISTLRAQDDDKIEAVPVADNIFMLDGEGGNIGLFIGKDGTFLIDDQFAPLTQKILAAIELVGGDTPLN